MAFDKPGPAKGSPKNGGRKKGTPNKDCIPAQELCEKLGIDPLEVLLRATAGDWEGLGYTSEMVTKIIDGAPVYVERIPLEMRVNAARAALPYIRPQRKAIEWKGNDGESPFGALAEAMAKVMTKANES